MKDPKEVQPEEEKELGDEELEGAKKPEVVEPKPEEAELREVKKPEFATVRGKIVLGEKPLQGVTVKIGDLSAVTNEQGLYEISGIHPAMHQVSVSCPSDLPYEAPSRTVDLTAGSVALVDFSLTEATVIQGHVYGFDGKLIEGAIVSGVLCGLNVEKKTTDGEGFFRFTHVTPGRRFMRVGGPSHMIQTRDVDVEQGKATSVDFHLKTGSSRIYGRVSDNAGKPVSAQVLLLKGGMLLHTVGSAPDGSYEFASLELGRYEVTLTAKGYKPKAWYGDLSEEAEVNLTLQPADMSSAQQLQRFRRR